MILAAFGLGYLIGSVPTAVWLARVMKGIDLRRVGSGNPGANNALKTGGAGLAATVLLVEMAKGVVAVMTGQAVAGPEGALAAGLGAVTGNVYNVFLGLEGGKGLGISGGVLLGLWPTVVVPIILVLALAARATRSTGAATIIGIVAINLMAAMWAGLDLPTGWGLADQDMLVVLSIGIGVLLWQKSWASARVSRSSPA
jgi:glycerol-3-phosphate acyltransferase PlsY